jgi:Flp pilus assembly protein TadD
MKTKLIPAAVAALVLTVLASAQTPPAPATPADAPALHQQSIASLRQKKAKDAVEFAEQATKADPTKAEYFSQLGIALSQRMNEVNFVQMGVLSGKLKKAFEKSIALDPNHVPGLIGLTRFYAGAPEIAGGSLEKAAELATRLQKIDPFLGTVEFARINEKDEKFAEALALYESAARLKPEHAGVQNACGRMLVKLGRKEAARGRFEAALKLNPELEAAKQGLAELAAPSN